MKGNLKFRVEIVLHFISLKKFKYDYMQMKLFVLNDEDVFTKFFFVLWMGNKQFFNLIFQLI